MNNRRVGTEYEDRACAYLEGEGYRILNRNFRVRQAELDIVAQDAKTLVFLEVKYRRDLSRGEPLAAVDLRKQRQISRAALFYMNRFGIHPDHQTIRFDVIGILGNKLTHVKNAFDYIG